MFSKKELKVIQIYSDDDEIKGLTPSVKIKFIENILSYKQFDKSELHLVDNKMHTKLLIDGKLYDLHLTFKECENGKYIVESQKAVLDDAPYEDSIQKEVAVLPPSETKEKEEPQEENVSPKNEPEVIADSQAEDVHKEVVEEKEGFQKKKINCDKKVMEFYLEVLSLSDEIIKVNKSLFKVHSYDEFKNENNKRYPYIYRFRETIDIAYSDGNKDNFNYELLAKLAVYYTLIEKEKVKLEQLNRMDNFNEEFVEVASVIRKRKTIPMLEHIGAEKLITLINENKNEEKE